MHKIHFTLITFAPSGADVRVKDILLNQGHRVRALYGDDWLQAAAPIETPVILFVGEAGLPEVRIVAALGGLKCPVLGIFDGDAAGGYRALAQRCSERLCWPGAADDLAAVLQRILNGAAAVAMRDDGSTVLEDGGLLNMIGTSPAFRETLGRIRRISRCDVQIMIDGETGTGKEMAARAIHYLSARRDFPFIPVNCGAIPDNLVENELFGHAKGAFTDAREAQAGLVKQADGGTLFLDEVDALSPKSQVSLLRFLQDRQYRPLGGQRLLSSDVRVISATNADLAKLTEEGRFRSDLLFRLNIMTVNMPPLRERRQDIALLADHFIRQLSARYGQPRKSLHADTLAWLKCYQWPGNIRELENFLHREYLLTDGDVIAIDSHSSSGDSDERRGRKSDRRASGSQITGLGFSTAKTRVIAEFEKTYLEHLMSESQGNVTAAAKLAGKERRAFGKLLKKYGLQKDHYAQQ
jgi:two-component system response regulator GlrR